MNTGLKITALICFVWCAIAPACCRAQQMEHGGIVRMDSSRKDIYLVFTGHEFAEGFPEVKAALRRHRVAANFFFTGDFYRNPEFALLIRYLVKKGHYLGAHSDKHLLYCAWEDRDSLLVDRGTFRGDLLDNYREMERFGIRKEKAPYYMPPYEWYNDSISRWCAELGITLVNFTPGTTSNADWTYPELGASYRDSESIYRRILGYEEASGLNGFILLLHIGSDPRRTDKFTAYLDDLIGALKSRGYSFRHFDPAMAAAGNKPRIP
jgi:peptidoglycan/xylan/chitin deacetylase (PgdA/CDA1 family)